MARTAFISRAMLTRGALTRASTRGTRPSCAEARLLTRASIPEMPRGADPPKASCSCRAPLIMYFVPRCSLRRPASVSEVTKRPWPSAVHRRWSVAVASGVQDRNWPGFTPRTLARCPLSLIAAPSAVITWRTPAVADSFASCRADRPDGSITSRSGEMILWKLLRSRWPGRTRWGTPWRPGRPPGARDAWPWTPPAGERPPRRTPEPASRAFAAVDGAVHRGRRLIASQPYKPVLGQLKTGHPRARKSYTTTALR